MLQGARYEDQNDYFCSYKAPTLIIKCSIELDSLETIFKLTRSVFLS